MIVSLEPLAQTDRWIGGLEAISDMAEQVKETFPEMSDSAEAAMNIIAGASDSAAKALEGLKDKTLSMEEAAGILQGTFTTLIRSMIDFSQHTDTATAAIERQFAYIETALSQLVSGNALGAGITIVGGFIDGVVSFFDELINGGERAARENAYNMQSIQNDLVMLSDAFEEEFGKVMGVLEDISGITMDRALEGVIEGTEKFLDAQEEMYDEAAEAAKEWADKVNEATESVVDAQEDAADTLADIQRDILDSRLDLAEASGLGELELLIAETQIALLDAHAEFKQNMADLTVEREKYILDYMLAEGVTRAEAAAAADQLFGPLEDAFKENYATTSAAILESSQEEAKKLCLSEKEFWRAVMEGNSEVLGDMTEEQRQAYLDYILLAQQYGIEIPKWLTDMYNDIYGAQTEGGAQVSEGTQMSGEQMRASLDTIYTILRQIFGEDADEIIALIKDLYFRQSVAHELGSEESANAAEAGMGNQWAVLDSLYETLRSIFGEDAERIIAMIEGMYTGQAAAHYLGADEVSEAVDEGSGKQTTAISGAQSVIENAWRRFGDNAGGAAGVAFETYFGKIKDGAGYSAAVVDAARAVLESSFATFGD